MGHPKKQRKKHETPKKPYDKARIEREKRIKDTFGLRRKKEIWRAESVIRQFRRRARELQAHRNEKEEMILLGTMRKLGISCAGLQDILDTNLDDILSRRLQTIVYKKGFSNTIRHSRQLIVHGHVSLAGRKITHPSYIVPSGDDEKIIVSPKIKTAPEEKKG